MNAAVIWAMTGLILIVLAGVMGDHVTLKGPLGILIDERGRYSLTHLQVVLWSLVLISLVAAIFLARAFGGLPPAEWLNIEIPPEILILAGISGGSGIVSTAVKSSRSAAIRLAAVFDAKARFSQVYMMEEGGMADQVIDVAKFQNFFLTFIAVGAYVAMAAAALTATPLPAGFPGFNESLLWLIGISHAAYVGDKFPQRQ